MGADKTSYLRDTQGKGPLHQITPPAVSVPFHSETGDKGLSQGRGGERKLSEPKIMPDACVANKEQMLPKGCLYFIQRLVLGKRTALLPSVIDPSVSGCRGQQGVPRGGSEALN